MKHIIVLSSVCLYAVGVARTHGEQVDIGHCQLIGISQCSFHVTPDHKTEYTIAWLVLKYSILLVYGHVCFLLYMCSLQVL